MVRVQDPVVPGTTYQLRANGRTFSYQAVPGDDATAVALEFAAELLEGQTVLAVLADDRDLFLAGAIAQTFAVEVLAGDLEVLPVQEAVEERPAGRLRVYRVRPYWTKRRGSEDPIPQVMLTVHREVEGVVNVVGAPAIGISPTFEIQGSRILSILFRASTGQVSRFDPDNVELP